jgi:hypothetical protein
LRALKKPTGREVVPRLWYVKKQGALRGPFPSGAIIQDRLVGRLSAQDELSPDREEWRVFDAWPELASALAAAPDAAAGTADSEWLDERAKARLRWADERSVPDRRGDQHNTSDASERREVERRVQGVDHAKRSATRSRPGFVNDRITLKLVAILVICAGLLALLAWLYGPVNPVPVHIR